MKQNFLLEDSMVMYGIYNTDTLINTVHKMYNTTTWNEKIFASKLNHWYLWVFIQGWRWPLCHKFSLVFNNAKWKNTLKCMRNLSVSYECMPSNKSSFQGLFIHFPFATINIRRHFRQSQKGYSDYKPRLWYSHNNIAFILWHKINYIWHWWK